MSGVSLPNVTICRLRKKLRCLFPFPHRFLFVSHYKFSFIGPKPPTAAEERNQGVFFRFLIALFSYVALQGLLAQRHQLPLKK